MNEFSKSVYSEKDYYFVYSQTSFSDRRATAIGSGEKQTVI